MKIIIGITGASGSVYAARLIEELFSAGAELHLIVTDNGAAVMKHETGLSPEALLKKLPAAENRKTPVIHSNDDLFAPPASGSFRTDAMVIVPCSMATLGGAATGSLHSLLGRAADVCLKERRRLIVVPRETPLSSIHIRNMLTLSEAGATILPAMPGFYSRPESVGDMVDFVAGRIIDQLSIENSLSPRWTGG